ncbi:MAG: hypothetical protein CM1200mP18_20980 [Gammaproteobacteria bacterium]|nr:MAG: hypothetical protein CM1200mP18_20980 [Gammaproteobacteria bacterium]
MIRNSEGSPIIDGTAVHRSRLNILLCLVFSSVIAMMILTEVVHLKRLELERFSPISFLESNNATTGPIGMPY